MKKNKQIFAFVLTLIMVFSNMGTTSLNVRAEGGATAPIILHTDDFENYEAGTEMADVSGSDISVSNSDANVTVSEKIDGMTGDVGITDELVTATVPGVYYKDDFESYTVGSNVFNGGVTFNGTGSTIAIANGVDGENRYLKFG